MFKKGEYILLEKYIKTIIRLILKKEDEASRESSIKTIKNKRK